MNLSITERMMLINQYEILSRLNPGEVENYQESITVLSNGYELHYDNLMPFLSIGEKVVTIEESREVVDILEMFRRIKWAYDALSDKPEIEEWRMSFSGFDGNEESKYLAYAEWYCRRGRGYFTDITEGINFDGPGPRLSFYRLMVKEWKKSADPHKLTAEDIVRITSVQVK